ncbi:MAG: rod shape-determining protein RodA [Ignavibacteriales bacterium]
MLGHRMAKVIDKPFIISLFALMLFGVIVLVSASSTIASDPLFYVKKQLMWIAIGIGLVVFILNIDYQQGTRNSRILYIATIAILLAVLFFGKEVRGSQGWIVIAGQQLQPAEFAKIMVVLCFADFLSQRQGMLNTLGEILPCFLYIGLPFLLVLAQPDLGTSLAFLAITFGMMFVAGANPKILLWIIFGGLAFALLVFFLHQQFGMWLPLEDYQIKRLTVFLDPYNDGLGGRGAGWNTIQSLVAIGSGGLFGKGLFQGSQAQLNFLPEHHTDFIFAVLGEEMGFIGAALLLLLYAILIARAIVIASGAKDFFSTLVVVGLISMWLFHIFENIGMSIGLMPITGVPLPFVSYGGSFMLANMIGIGLLLDINLKGRRIVF